MKLKLKTKKANNWRSLKSLPIFQPLRTIFKYFSSYWFACIPLSAIIVLVWNSAATAQDFEAPASLDELRVVLDTVFLLLCSILVIFMNAGFGMLEAGFCRQKNAVNILAKNLIVFAIAKKLSGISSDTWHTSP